MIIKNTTKHTKELNTAFQKAHFIKTVLPFQIWITVIFLVLGGLSFIGDVELGCYVFGGVVLFNTLLPLMVVFTQKRVDKSFNSLHGGLTNSYEFNETGIKIDTISSSISSNAVHAYSLITSVLVSDKFIALYISKSNAFIIDPDGFTSGSHQELVNLLKQKIDPGKVKS